MTGRPHQQGKTEWANSVQVLLAVPNAVGAVVQIMQFIRSGETQHLISALLFLLAVVGIAALFTVYKNRGPIFGTCLGVVCLMAAAGAIVIWLSAPGSSPSDRVVPSGPGAGTETRPQPTTMNPTSTAPAPPSKTETGWGSGQPGEQLVPAERSDSPHAPAPPPAAMTPPPAAPAPAAVAPTPRVALYPGEQLGPGEQLQSPDGRFVLVMQLDGNLVQRAPGNQPVWSTNTFRSHSVAMMQSDGNFVVRAPGNIPVWATNTSYPDSVLEIQDDGNIVVYSPGHIARWSSFDNGSTLVNR